MTGARKHEHPLVAVLVLALLACVGVACQDSTSPAETPTPAAERTAAASAHSVDPDYLVLSREAHHLMEQAGDEAWRDWAEGVPAVVVMMGERAVVIGTPPTGGEWEQVRPGEWEGPGIPGVRPGVQVADGQPFAATIPLDDLQSLIDEAVGEGRVTLDAPGYIRFVVHEAFHAFQIATLNGELPDFGLQGNERDLLPELAEPDVAAGVAHEARLLAAALRAETDADAVAAARELLIARSSRRLAMSDDATALERSLEWTEGLARYADIALVEAAARDYEATRNFTAMASYPPTGEAVAGLLKWLDDLPSVPGTVRDRYYEVGAGEARLLDRLMPGWHTRALPGREALESLLEEAVEKADAGIAPTRRALESRTISVTQTEPVAVATNRLLVQRAGRGRRRDGAGCCAARASG